MNDAWFGGAPSVNFNGIKQGDFQTEIEAAAAADAEIADLRSELNKKIDARDDKYKALDQKRSKVGQGGAGGGKVVAVGTPEEVARVKRSYTGQALKALLK